MPFEDYHPKDRRLSGRAHLASWLVLGAFVGILLVVAPIVNSNAMQEQVFAAVEDEC